jgi:cob(I)alamin adenosyltransferase
MIQFIKGYADIGEARFAVEMGERFVLKQFACDPCRGIDESKVKQRREACETALGFAEEAVTGGGYGVVILDEVCNAVHYGLLDCARILELARRLPGEVELIITGRNAPPELMEAADYVTEMRCVKHPYEKGVPARRGIDY